MSKLIYLCGPISGTSYAECTDWRKTFKDHITTPGIVTLSPMRGKEYLSDEKNIGDDYAHTLMSTQRAITTRDRFDCLRCDALVGNFLGAKRVSIGSMIELGWVDGRNPKPPIILIMEPSTMDGLTRTGGNLHDHAMVREVANWIVPTVKEAATIIDKIFLEA